MSAISHSACTLRRTVTMVCGLLDERAQFGTGAGLTECDLRFELVSCLLGSQVRAESANAAAEYLQSEGLLSNDRWEVDDAAFEEDVRDVLAGRRSERRSPSYRFPALRARQLAQLRIRTRSRSLQSYLLGNAAAGEIRRNLVRELPGIGPKQASMFLRNIGVSQDVAILDVHVLRFLRLIEVLPSEEVHVSTLGSYERTEKVVREYASSVGRAVGHLDWAIWITMRAAREVGL